MGRKKDSASNLLVFGDLNMDIIGRVDAWPAPGGECLCPQLELHCGGVGANCALALAPWGINVCLLGCVGQDRFGDLLLNTLRKTGVDIRGVQRSPRSLTGMSNPRESFLQFERAGTREIVMKIGKLGCLISDGGILREVPSFAVRAVDSTGAGDAFTAAFLQARMRGWSTLEAALTANAAGAAAASRVGAGTMLSDVAGALKLLRTQRLKGTWEEIRLQVLSRVQRVRGF